MGSPDSKTGPRRGQGPGGTPKNGYKESRLLFFFLFFWLELAVPPDSGIFWLELRALGATLQDFDP